MSSHDTEGKLLVGGFFGTIAFGAVCLAGWVTHVVITIQDENWILLAIGAIGVPIGVIHGIGHWFGIW